MRHEGACEPIVAVTAPVRRDEAGMAGLVLESGYLEGVRIACGLPVLISTATPPGLRERLFDLSRGVILTGGEDVDPRFYGEERDGARRTSPERDAMELDLVGGALERRIPVLAICRGVQLLNVALGGTLYQDLQTQLDGGIDHDRWREYAGSIHPILPDGSRELAGVLAAEPFEQNSAHHQGIKDLASSLRAVAHAPDGLIEAVEYAHPEGAWVVGVQWHPERKLGEDSGTNRRLFERFGEEVRRAAGGAGQP